MTAATVWINGRRAARLSALDRGLHYGDGLFETLACLKGRPRFLSLHLARLALGCARLRLSAPGPQRLRAAIEQAAAQADRSIVKLLVTRGPAVARGYAAGGEQGSWLVIRYPWPEEDPALAGLKHLNRLEQILARNEDSVIEAEETLMLSHSGKLISGTMSNVFLVHEAGGRLRLRTPDLALCGVAGVMRSVVLREAAQEGISASECALAPPDLDTAAEVFLTNARIGIWPVRSIDGRPLAPGPLTRALQGRLAPLLEAADA